MLDAGVGRTLLRLEEDDMERLELINVKIGVTEQGMYCTTFLTPEGLELKDADPLFKGILDAVATAVAQVLHDAAPNGVSAARSSGPGAETLAKAMGEQGVDIEVVDEPVFGNRGSQVH